ncbi:hypothetical protein MLD38_001035 [Melastoma candidum]|uniref:Uncharacterized protein n=1 Tax=Melastoma candidum TaxID=119954 RepID=A0ACB9SCX5_9MYRT|nr:hypothetical protein MLD38_001035 [Melastoma candidum]
MLKGLLNDCSYVFSKPGANSEKTSRAIYSEENVEFDYELVAVALCDDDSDLKRVKHIVDPSLNRKQRGWNVRIGTEEIYAEFYHPQPVINVHIKRTV